MSAFATDRQQTITLLSLSISSYGKGSQGGLGALSPVKSRFGHTETDDTTTKDDTPQRGAQIGEELSRW